MNKNTKAGRGRPRSFDEGAVLRQAQALFLARGFEATSYDDVADAVGLAKPSLYNAFGDKTALFERAIADYAGHARAQILTAFAAADNLSAAGKAVLLAGADVYAPPDAPSVGCLLVGTALPACVPLEQPRQTLATFIDNLESQLEQVIATRYVKDVSRTGKTPKALALQLTSLLFSLAVRARTGVSRRKLRAIAADLASLIG